MPYGNMTHSSSKVSFALLIWASSAPLRYGIDMVTSVAFQTVVYFRYQKSVLCDCHTINSVTIDYWFQQYLILDDMKSILIFLKEASINILSRTQSNDEHWSHEKRKIDTEKHWQVFWCNNSSWWRHQMETFSALLAICAGNLPVPGEFPAQRPVTRSFDVFFDLHLNKRLSKQWWGWWFETLRHPLWRHRNVADLTRPDLGRPHKWWVHIALHAILVSHRLINRL